MSGKAPDGDPPRKPRQRGIEVRDGELKLRFFYQWHVGIGRCPSRVSCAHQFVFRSRKEMAEKLGLTDAQLEGVAGDGYSHRRYSEATLEKLGEQLGFNAFSPEFLHGEALAFAKDYNAANSCKQEYLKRSTGTSVLPGEPREEQPHKERRLGLRLISRHDGNKPWLEYDLLASLELFAEQSDPGECCLRAVLTCLPAPIEGGKIGVRSGKLNISRSEAFIADIGERNPESKWSSIKNGDGRNVILQRAGTSQDRAYVVVAESGCIGEVRLQADFWRLTSLAPGDLIEMAFAVFIRDLEYPGESQSFMRGDGKPLGKMKQAILNRLKCSHLALDKNGWVELCGDAIRFEQDHNDEPGDC